MRAVDLGDTVRVLQPRRCELTVAVLLGLVAFGCGGSDGKRLDAANDGVRGPTDAGTVDWVTLADTGASSPEVGEGDLSPEMPDGGASLDGEAALDGPGSLPADAETSDATNDSGKATQPPVSLVVLPDTQYYTTAYPGVFELQTRWIVSQKSALNIVGVLHVGDVVDSDVTDQWTVANPAMRLLDHVVPYVVVPGNHDYRNTARQTLIDNYFSPGSMPWIAGTMLPDQIENSYAFMDIGPQRWLILGLEFGPRDAVVAWANSVLKQYSNYPAILLTHAYLYSDGTRYDIAVGGTDAHHGTSFQAWYPSRDGLTPSEGTNDGEALWQKLVLPNSNVRLVFCGHQTGWARLTSTRPDGTTVHQMLSDYQWLDQISFGYGYLRTVQFDYQQRTIHVETFSPYLNGYLTDDGNQFTLDLNL